MWPSRTTYCIPVCVLQEHLEGLRVALLDGKVALKDLAITKQLTKDPNDYADKKALPHVQVRYSTTFDSISL